MMAVRSLEAPGYPTPAACVDGAEPYVDVAHDDPFCPWIQELKNRGFAQACDGVDHYCPKGALVRDTAALVLTRAFEMELYEP